MMNAKQYLTKHNLHNTHWGERIIDAEANGYFNDEDEADAGSWVTCACGQLDDGIERTTSGEPKDAILTHMGVNFMAAIEETDYLETAKILNTIEIRAAELLLNADFRA